ncbi:MAG: hypothetical protein ACI85E_000985 [Marinomonas primoryensis]|jgi:hypothetical protein
MAQASNNLATNSWALADLLRGDFKQSLRGKDKLTGQSFERQ